MWISELDDINSLGSQIRPGSQGGLAKARSLHSSQFFTSAKIADFMWQWIAPLLSKTERHLSVIDSSVGSGRLLGPADPEKHTLYGIEIDARCIEALCKAAQKAGFNYEFINHSFVDCDYNGFDFAFINPPFSITLDSPSMVPLPCSTWGKFGEGKRANSTHYALEQALFGAAVVVVLLPSSMRKHVFEQNASQLSSFRGQLAAAIQLPADAFVNEGIIVDCTLFIFDSISRSEPVYESDTNVPIIDLGLTLPPQKIPHIKRYGVENSKPLIDLPVTGNRNVRIGHSSRWVSLKYSCGLTQALVMNAVLRSRIPSNTETRPARHVKYTGQGALDIEVWLANGTAEQGLAELVNTIENVGGVAIIDNGLQNYCKKRDRQSLIENVDYRKWVYRKSGASTLSEFVAVCTTTHIIEIDPSSWDNPVIVEGIELKMFAEGECYQFKHEDVEHIITEDTLSRYFELKDKDSDEGDWVLLHAGKVAAFPKFAKKIETEARKAGALDLVSWDYQSHDLIELLMESKGSICGWEMGLGKARIALALALMGGKHNLICVEPYLVDELMIELDGNSIDEELYQVITDQCQLFNLRKINIITYQKLKGRIRKSNGKFHPRKKFSHYLRRRVNTLIADEGSILANEYTQQSRALTHVSPKKRYVLDGTPIQNYPRGIRPILNFTAGDSTAKMPYGTHHYYTGKRTITCAQGAGRGVDQFREDFVTLEWCTNQFAENLTKGAKREIPKITDITKYRHLLNRNIKRRVQQEPEVKRFVNIEPPVRNDKVIDFSNSHLAHYLKVCDEFTEIFKREKQKAELAGKNLNLVALLARIGAVRLANNQPQRENRVGSFSGLTSKQAYVIDECIRLTKEGNKTIVYVDNPDTVDLLVREIQARSYDVMGFHGGIPIKKRTKELNDRFRFGNCPILIATIHTTQKGLNLYQANRVIMYSRDWKASKEEQAIYRLCRPQQVKTVYVEYVMHEGSIDIYQAQMVDFKRNAADAGLDYAQPEFDATEFLHMDTLLGRFVDDLSLLRGYESSHECRADMKIA